MRALSIRQPWAMLIVTGWKDIENRVWKTKFRGEVLIHAGTAFDHAAFKALVEQKWVEGKAIPPSPELFLRGGFVGKAEIVDCVQESTSPWFSGPNGLVLKNNKMLPFRKYKGQLGIFTVPDDVVYDLWPHK